MKVALYARVSTDEQTDLNQLPILEKWAADRQWEIVGVYRDVGSAWAVKGDRAELSRLMTDCNKGRVNLVLVYDLSRLTRKGPLEMLLTLKRFADNGAQVYSYSETWLNVPSEFHPVLISLYGYFAELFSRQLSARTKAGMARAKAQGIHVGRPAKAVYYDPDGGVHWHKSLDCPMVNNSSQYRTIGWATLKQRTAPDGKSYRLCPFCRLVKKGLREEYQPLLDKHTRLKELIK